MEPLALNVLHVGVIENGRKADWRPKSADLRSYSVHALFDKRLGITGTLAEANEFFFEALDDAAWPAHNSSRRSPSAPTSPSLGGGRSGSRRPSPSRARVPGLSRINTGAMNRPAGR
jgi:hypothetical protein